jgi:hypothetical protein
MAVIGFGEQDHRAWVAAGWAFRYVLDEASKLCPNDKEICDTLDLAVDIGYLQVQFLDAAMASRIAAIIRSVAQAEVNEDRNEFLDEEWQDSWKSSMRELLNAASA